jgi:drug/metabolite transporter (DMT)-like permease
MRTTPTPAFVLSLLTPVLALAQMGPTDDRWVTQSSSFWFWVIALAIAVVAFIVANIVFNRRLPPTGPRGL